MSVRDRVTSFFVSQLHAMLELPVIRAKQDVAIEFEKYVVVDLMGERSLGDFEQWDEENEKIYIACLREATLNVQAFGDGSVELLADLWGKLERPQVVDEFNKANIAVNYPSEVQDLTDLLDGRGYRERASLDLTVSFDRTAVDSPEWFDTVEFVMGLHEQNKKEIKKIKFIERGY
ncbi:MAG: hypothetical protein IKW14_06235 [Phascolarctobacterium sp.]|nr:hypothetical protein [Phascolarctobacterium sp.]